MNSTERLISCRFPCVIETFSFKEMVRTKQTARKSVPSPSKLKKLEAKRLSHSKASAKKDETIKKRRFRPGSIFSFSHLIAIFQEILCSVLLFWRNYEGRIWKERLLM